MIHENFGNQKLVAKLENLGENDTEFVGGKSANLGELMDIGIPVPPGFTTTSKAYSKFLQEKGIKLEIKQHLNEINTEEVEELQEKAEKIRETINNTEIPDEIKKAVEEKYEQLAEETGKQNPNVAVRSSATAEDLPDASFAGQQDTFLNVSGKEELLESIKDCYSSLFTARAISYREENGFNHLDVKLSCTVQLMARPDGKASGVMFTMDPDSGFEEVATIEAAYGLGELVVAGEVNPDTYTVFKGTNSVIEKEKGSKEKMMVRSDQGNETLEVGKSKRNEFVLEDQEAEKLAVYAQKIENHYQRPMDIEWVYDKDLQKFFIVQARPETVHSGRSENIIESYSMKEQAETLLEGQSVGDKIGSGKVRKLEKPEEMDQFIEGDVLVTERTDPDWEPVMKKASAIITEKGGRTSHAAIVSRELGVPAIVGAEDARSELNESHEVTVDCTDSVGKVMKGELEFEVHRHGIEEMPETEIDVMLILGNASKAFQYSQLPVDGVGLAREEFIIGSHIGEHPLELIEEDREDEFVKTLSEGISKIAAAFYPQKVILRLSDFKSDEYADLKGGEKHEPDESNPMLGFRGASRYYDERFSRAFELECEAIRRARQEKGLENLTVMVPFCRTPQEGKQVKKEMKENGLDTESFKSYLMAELPSNIKMAEEFGKDFDGFSIGSNDLTQLTFGVDRNSEKLQHLFNEDHPAVKRMVRELISKADKSDCTVSICGDAPSSIEGYVEFLVSEGIDSISVSPDVAVETVMKVKDAEDRIVEDYVRDGMPMKSISSN